MQSTTSLSQRDVWLEGSTLQTNDAKVEGTRGVGRCTETRTERWQGQAERDWERQRAEARVDVRCVHNQQLSRPHPVPSLRRGASDSRRGERERQRARPAASSRFRVGRPAAYTEDARHSVARVVDSRKSSRRVRRSRGGFGRRCGGSKARVQRRPTTGSQARLSASGGDTSRAQCDDSRQRREESRGGFTEGARTRRRNFRATCEGPRSFESSGGRGVQSRRSRAASRRTSTSEGFAGNVGTEPTEFRLDTRALL